MSFFSFTPDVTLAFTAWWDGIRDKLFGKPLSDVLGLFSFIPTEIVGSATVQSAGTKHRLSPGTIVIVLCNCIIAESFASLDVDCTCVTDAGMEAKIEDDTSSSSTYGDSRTKVCLSSNHCFLLVFFLICVLIVSLLLFGFHIGAP